MSSQCIQVRGVRVHNLKAIDLDLPRGRLIVFCGVSGSGKTSLALDTLYAEGQRRYIESFSAHTRQFLERLEKPDADRIDGLPPALAVTRKSTTRSNRATIASATETADYLRLLYAKIGRVVCRGCGQLVQRQTPQSAAEQLAALPAGTRYLLTFARRVFPGEDLSTVAAELQADGFVRVIAGGKLLHLAETDLPTAAAGATQDESAVAPSENNAAQHPTVSAFTPGADAESVLLVVTDRLTAGSVTLLRLRDSLEIAFAKGAGSCYAWVLTQGEPSAAPDLWQIDGRLWQRLAFHAALRCEDCGRDYPTPEPRLYDYNSPLGACPRCEGFGDTADVDMNLVVPDKTKSLRGGAVAPWNSPAYAHELEELLALADDFGVPVEVPFQQLGEASLRIVQEGVPARNFGGLRGFFAWLERHTYKVHVRAFLARWRSYRTCPACGGKRLRDDALATRVGGKDIAEFCRLSITEARDFVCSLPLTDAERAVARTILDQVHARLRYLGDVGLGYLPLDRTIRTLSGGEAQRVAMTATLGSNLVNMLYVLDEPSVGLHPCDVDRLTDAVVRLRDRGNTVVVTEHETGIIRRADQVIEFGPGAGERGGQVVFQGTAQQLVLPQASLTGEYLSGRRGVSNPERRRPTNRGTIQLTGARGNNLKNLTVNFPLGVLCLVTGVSGAGKSTLVHETLYGALCGRKRREVAAPYPFDDVFGDGQIDDVMLVDQSPIGRSPRSNPVTYIKAFDPIREVFAGTVEARTHNYSASHFSFNVEGGRCEACGGDGFVEIDMQFLPDVYVKCSQCQGTRYRKQILQVTYRGRNIAEVLQMTVREAFSFFRGQRKVQAKLKQLIDVGLDYLRLGQPATTLSSGEAQRLKLAAFMSAATRNRTLFLLDEPTTGLHFSDVVRLLDCFDTLLAVGHSLIVVEHNLQLMKAADWLIDLGPGAADAGGEIVVQGPPETVAQCDRSVTGRYLRQELER